MVNDNPQPGSKADAIFTALSEVEPGNSVFMFFVKGRVSCYWTLTHERFMVNGKMNLSEQGEMKKICHLQLWQQPDRKELGDLVRRYESHAGKTFTITNKRVESRMLRIQRIC